MAKKNNNLTGKPYNISLGSTLKRLRKDKKITQAEAAEYIDVKRATISAYESGRITPSLSNLMRFAKLYGVSQETLLSLLDDSEKVSKMVHSADHTYPVAANEFYTLYKKLTPELQETVFLLVKDLYKGGRYQ